MPVIRVEPHPSGPRVFLFNRRLHHGFAGLLAIAGGIVAVIHDWADRPWTRDLP